MTRKITLRLLACAAALLTAAASPCAAAVHNWEQLKSERPDSHTVGKTSDVEIKAAKGYIYIHTARQLTLKVYTILGQLVASETLQPGAFQLPLSSHGIYIVKAGDNLTFKVAV